MRLTLLVAALACALACSGPIEYGNPEGYTVHFLYGSDLLATDVTLNGLRIDTRSPEAIDASAQALVDATRAPHCVDELPAAGAADLAVDFTASRPLPPHFYGGNIQWFSKFWFDVPEYRALVRHLRIDRLRFPAGLERGQYERTATPSPADDLGHERFRLTGPDVARFIALCRESGIAAEPQVNTAEDHPEMWAEMIDQIVNELAYDLRFVAVGNEPDVDTDRSPWSLYGATTLEGALQAYAERYLRYRQAIEAVKPGLRYVYGEFSSPDSAAPAAPLVTAAPPEAVSAHWYPTGEWPGLSPSDPYYPSFDHLNGDAIHGQLDGLLAKLQGGTRPLGDPELILGEFATTWAVTPNAATTQDALGTALFSAEVHEYAKAIGIDSVAYWSLSDPGSWENWKTSLLVLEEGRVGVRPQFYVPFIYRHLYGDEVVAVPGGRTRDWSIHAAHGPAGNDLMLVNRSPTEKVQKVLAVTTAAGTRRLRLTLYPHSLAVVRF